MEKSIFLSKTFWFNVLVLLVGVAGVFGFADHQPGPEARENIGALVALVVALAPVINIILRKVTKVPVAFKRP